MRRKLEREMGKAVTRLRKVLGPFGIAALAGPLPGSFAAPVDLSSVAARVQSLLSSLCGGKPSLAGSVDDRPKRNIVDVGLTKLLTDSGNRLTDDELRCGFLLLCKRNCDTGDPTVDTIVQKAVVHVRRAYGVESHGTSSPSAAARQWSTSPLSP